MTSFYSQEELVHLGFKSIGNNVLISKKSSFYGINKICIGNNVRIDDFCIFSTGNGGIEIGNNVHVAAYVSIIGESKITINDYSGISSRVSIYSSNDDYSGEFMSNPTVPSKFTNVFSKDVLISKHVLVGSGSIILPGVTLHEGSVIGALSLVNKDCENFFIYKGNPAKKIVRRSKRLLELEVQFLSSMQSIKSYK